MGKLFVRLGRTGVVLLVGLTFACSGSPNSSATSLQEASVVSPKGPGGASVPGVPSEAVSFFQRSMGGIVACHETVGTVQPHYDEEGRCDENGQASAWTMVPQTPFVATVESFVPGDRRSVTVGEYKGTLAFDEPSGRRCAWQVTLSFSGEDLLVDLVPTVGNACGVALP